MEPPKRWPADAPEMRSAKVTLFVLVDDVPMWATAVGKKRTLLEQTEGLPLWGFWKGDYSAHLFEIDREQAELEIQVGADRARSADPNVQALLEWFGKEAARQGFLSDHVSYATSEVSAAKRLLANVPKGRIAAVAQHALTSDRHREWVHNVAALNRQWNRLLASWEAAGSPSYDADYVYEEGDGAQPG